jgi:hypothetical protein
MEFAILNLKTMKMQKNFQNEHYLFKISSLEKITFLTRHKSWLNQFRERKLRRGISLVIKVFRNFRKPL